MAEQLSQLDFYNQLDTFKLDGKSRWTRTFPLYDAIPKFSYGEDARSKITVVIPKTIGFTFRGNEYELTLLPGAVVRKTKTGVETFHKWPGEREELIMRGIRFLAVQGKGDTKYVPRQITVVFTQTRLQTLLRDWGHHFDNKQLQESFRILLNSTLEFVSKPNLHSEYQGACPLIAGWERVKKDGIVQYAVTLNRLELEAIHSGSYRAINFEAILGLKSPLARRLYEILMIKHTNAERPNNGKAKAYPIQLSELIKEGTINERTELRKTARRIREALEELTKKGHLWCANPFEETPILDASAGGRPGHIDYIWEIWLSDVAVSDMISSHSEAAPVDKQDLAMRSLPQETQIRYRKDAQKHLK
jgi:hypothetical protein